MGPELYVKICGLTREEDVDAVIHSGASAIGLNLWPGSPRSVSLQRAKVLAQRARGKVEVVTVTVDASDAQLEEIRRTLQPDRMQLHAGRQQGEAQVARFERAYLAVGLREPADAQWALSAPGEWVLVDAKDEVRRGGTGRAPPEALAAQVCKGRATLLAGGLSAHNVAAAIAALAPAGVDVASGVETAPGQKSPSAIEALVRAARSPTVVEEKH